MIQLTADHKEYNSEVYLRSSDKVYKCKVIEIQTSPLGFVTSVRVRITDEGVEFGKEYTIKYVIE